jgi:predicted nuclease with TOPRIM domain
VTGSLLDESGRPVDLVSELAEVQGELEAIKEEVRALEQRNEQIRAQSQNAQQEFEGMLLGANGGELFEMLKVNGATKKKIIGLIKQLKEVSKKIKDTKSQY